VINLPAIVLRKGAPTLDLKNNWEIAFLHEHVRVEGPRWRTTLLSISLVYCANGKIIIDCV
jgi:hypothetical protein